MINKTKKGFDLLQRFIKTVDRIVIWLSNIEKWSKTIKSALKYTEAFKNDVQEIWKKDKEINSAFTSEVELETQVKKDD